MDLFLNDYELGLIEKRYKFESLPKLSFKNKEFDLVLSSHFLFLYSDQLDYDFHLDSIQELIRVGNRIKIFPLCNLDGSLSNHLPGILHWLDNKEITYRIVKTEYEYQKGSDSYLEINL